MKHNILDLFADSLLRELSIRKLGFKRFKTGMIFSNTRVKDGEIIPCPVEESFLFDINFIKENLAAIHCNIPFYDKEILYSTTSKLMDDYPDIVFSQMGLLPINLKDPSYEGYNSIALMRFFNNKDRVKYLNNCTEKQFLCTSLISLKDSLACLIGCVKDRAACEKIIFHTLCLHEALIKSSNKNLIAMGHWVSRNMSDKELFKPFYDTETTKPLFHDLQLKTTIKHFELDLIYAKYRLHDDTKILDYKHYLATLCANLSSKKIRSILDIKHADGQLIFKNKVYQLSVFHKKDFDNNILENVIETLLRSACECINENKTSYDKIKALQPQILKRFEINYLKHKLENTLPTTGKSEKISRRKI